MFEILCLSSESYVIVSLQSCNWLNKAKPYLIQILIFRCFEFFLRVHPGLLVS